MRGLKGVILGVANSRSIAWGIAKAVRAAGAEIALTYQGEALEKRVRPLAAELERRCARPLRRHRRRDHRRGVRRSRKALGRHRFRRPLHRLRRQGPIDRPLHRHDRGQFHQVAGDLLLFLHRDRAARGKADEERRLDADPDLLRRRKMDAALQRHGRRQGRARGERALPRRRPRASRTSASTRSRPARSRRSRPRGSATSAISCAGTNTTRRCAAPSRSRKSARARSTCCRRCRSASPAKSCTSTPAITSSA